MEIKFATEVNGVNVDVTVNEYEIMNDFLEISLEKLKGLIKKQKNIVEIDKKTSLYLEDYNIYD